MKNGEAENEEQYRPTSSGMGQICAPAYAPRRESEVPGAGSAGPGGCSPWITQPASVTPPVRSYDFTEIGGGGPTAIADGAFAAVTNYRVPQGWNAVVKEIGFEAESGAALADVQFRILIDGVPVPGLHDIRNPSPALPGTIPVTIKAAEGQRIIAQGISLTVGVPHFVRVLLKGWAFQPSFMTNLDATTGWRGQ